MRITKDEDNGLRQFIDQYLDAKRDADQANERLKAASQALTAAMAQRKTKNASWDEGNLTRTVTYVTQNRVTIDEKALRKALTARVFDRYTKKILDRSALEKAMDAGEVDPVTVAKYSEVTTTAPFIRFSEKESNE